MSDSCPVCDQPRLPWWPPWSSPDPQDAAWAFVYLVPGAWDAQHRGGIVPSRKRRLDTATELYNRHGEPTLRRALTLVADQPLPHGVDHAGKLACAALAARLDRWMAA